MSVGHACGESERTISLLVLELRMAARTRHTHTGVLEEVGIEVWMGQEMVPREGE